MAEGIVGLTPASTSATGQQGSHQNVAPRVALWLGEQTSSNALVQTFNGPDFPLRLVEGRAYHRLGDRTQESGVSSGVSCDIAATAELFEKGDRTLNRLGTIDCKITRSLFALSRLHVFTFHVSRTTFVVNATNYPGIC